MGITDSFNNAKTQTSTLLRTGLIRSVKSRSKVAKSLGIDPDPRIFDLHCHSARFGHSDTDSYLAVQLRKLDGIVQKIGKKTLQVDLIPKHLGIELGEFTRALSYNKAQDVPVPSMSLAPVGMNQLVGPWSVQDGNWPSV